MGAGTRFFAPAGDRRLGNIPSARPDARDVIADFKKAGYAVVSNASELRTAGNPGKLLGLFHPRDMASRYDRILAAQGDARSKEALGFFPDQPTLEMMTERAIGVLSQDPDGFLLVVEAGYTTTFSNILRALGYKQR
jgi:alkaline phosphatase